MDYPAWFLFDPYVRDNGLIVDVYHSQAVVRVHMVWPGAPSMVKVDPRANYLPGSFLRPR